MTQLSAACNLMKVSSSVIINMRRRQRRRRQHEHFRTRAAPLQSMRARFLRLEFCWPAGKDDTPNIYISCVALKLRSELEVIVTSCANVAVGKSYDLLTVRRFQNAYDAAASAAAVALNDLAVTLQKFAGLIVMAKSTRERHLRATRQRRYCHEELRHHCHGCDVMLVPSSSFARLRFC